MFQVSGLGLEFGFRSRVSVSGFDFWFRFRVSVSGFGFRFWFRVLFRVSVSGLLRASPQDAVNPVEVGRVALGNAPELCARVIVSKLETRKSLISQQMRRFMVNQFPVNMALYLQRWPISSANNRIV